MKKNVIGFFELLTLSALMFAPMTLLLVDHQLLFPFITSKNFPWRLAIEIALVGWASLALLDARYRVNLRHPLFVSFSLFMLAMALANLLGLDPFRSFWSNAERMDGYIGLLHMYAFFLSAWGFFRVQDKDSSIVPSLVWGGLVVVIVAMSYETAFTQTVGEHAPLVLLLVLILMGLIMVPTFIKPSTTKTFLHGLLALGVMLGAMALFQDKERADSVLGNPIYLASFASFAVFISGYFLLHKDRLFGIRGVRELLYGSLIVFYILIIFETATRGAVLGLVFGGFTTMVLIALLARDPSELVWRRIAITCTALLVTITSLFFGFKEEIAQSTILPQGHLLQRAAEFSLEDTTTKHRLSNWGQAIDGWQERPLLGWGQENYIHVFSQYYRPNELYDAEHWFDRTHNMFLDWLVFGGVLGLGTFLLLLGTMVWIIWQKTVHLPVLGKSILTGIVVAYVAQNFVAFDALATGIWITTIMIVIALCYEPPQKGKLIMIRDEVAVFAIAGLCVAMTVWMSYSVWQPKQSVHSFMALLRGTIVETVPGVGTTQRPLTNAERLDYMNHVLEHENLFTQEYLEQLLNRPHVYLHETIDQDTQTLLIKQLTQTVETTIEENPHITRLPLFYGGFLQNGGQYEEAQKYLEHALETSPNKIQILWLLGQNAAHRGDSEAALRYMKQAAEVAPQYELAQTAYDRVKKQYGIE